MNITLMDIIIVPHHGVCACVCVRVMSVCVRVMSVCVAVCVVYVCVLVCACIHVLCECCEFVVSESVRVL